MKTLKLIALAAFALLFSQCKTTAPTAPSGPVPPLIEVAQILDTTRSIFFESAQQTNGDPLKAIELTAARLTSHSLVKSAESIDSSHIDIELKSGLRTIYFYRQIDSNGRSIFRGGRKSDRPAKVNLPFTLSANKITNKKVLIYAGAYREFYKAGELEHITDMLAKSPAKLDVTLLKDEQCGYQLVENFKDYGLVILDTHGDEDMFRSGATLTVFDAQKGDDAFREIVKNQIGPDGYTKLLSGELVFGADEKVLQIPGWWKSEPGRVNLLNIFISTKYIDELPPMPNTIVFANTCYSGYEKPTKHGGTPYKTAFINKNLISYYGYAYQSGSSNFVENGFAQAMEDNFVRRLTIDLDSTQIVHLDANGKESFDQRLYDDTHGRSVLYLKHFGADNYSYAQKCGDSLVDSRDGQKYATVCIGKQTWMAENLRYNAPGSTPYYYGRLYDPTTVMSGVCPNGWHAPSNAEWQQLFDLFGGIDKAGGALKSTSGDWDAPNLGATNVSGFKGLPGGYKTAAGPFAFLYAEGIFCSTSLDANGAPLMMFLDRNYVQAFIQARPTGAQASCRCLKD